MDLEDEASTSDPQVMFPLQLNKDGGLLNEEVDNITDEFESKPFGDDLLPSWLDESEPPHLSMVAIPLHPAPEADVLACGAEGELVDGFEVLVAPDEKEEERDVKDESAEAGVCGLRNLGNTCFMGAGVQCLVASPPLVALLLRPPATAACPDSLAARLSALAHKMWSGRYAVARPAGFKEALAARYPQFTDYRQHDCQEFLALVLDSLHEQMNSATLDSKLQDILETNCDHEKHINPSPCENLVNLSKETPYNYLKNTNNLRDKMDESNEFVLETSYVDKKMNNYVESDCIETPVSPKLPLSVKCTSDNACDSLRKNDETLISNKINESASENILNNYAQRLNGFEDILKDAKTSNVNVLVTNHIANNEIKFDSDKFPKTEKVRQGETFNLNSFHLYDNNTTNNGKRGKSKSTVTHYSSTVDFREGLDLKRLKLQRKEELKEEAGQELMDCDREKNHRMEDERKLKDSIKTLDKNYWMERERLRKNPEPGTAAGEAAHQEPGFDRDAEEHWQKHLAANRSVLVDTFQGQFKSTVVCATCKHVSVTFEPFMYLSVPLPHAMERQLCVSVVSGRELEPQQLTFTVNKQETIGKVKARLTQAAGRPFSSTTVLAEVLDCHISKILDDHSLVRYINFTNRSLYAFEVENFSCFAELPVGDDGDKGCEDMVDLTGDTCIICLEEKDSDMKRHFGCACILCDSCIMRSTQHYGDEVPKCPVCHNDLLMADLVPVSMSDKKPPLRMLNVSLVYRLDTAGDGSNNARMVQLFGHPRLLRLPNSIACHQLHEAVASLVPYSEPYKILLVNGKGHHCSRCMFHEHCRGCPVPWEGRLSLRTDDCLAAMFMEPVAELSAGHRSSHLQPPLYKSLTLYDCLQAFSQSDMLDEQNPWYCPNCKKNQCATKTLRVWRYPNYLIIYLKRFVFQDCVSLKLDDKVIFPVRGLDLSINGGILYDLYACVCHVGGTAAGHYTAYTEHPRSGEWHYFNDDSVSKKCPQEDDFSTAYILFYKRRGADFEDFDVQLFSTNGGSPLSN